jgi:hypothetical protein
MGMTGMGREKAQTAQRGKVATKDFERERTEKTEGKNFTKNALLLAGVWGLTGAGMGLVCKRIKL